MTFTSDIRSILNEEDDVIANFFKNGNTITVGLADLSVLSKDFIGDLPTTEFVHEIRNGIDLKSTFLKANPQVSEIVSKNDEALQLMARDSALLPEFDIAKVDLETTNIKERLPDLDSVGSAEELKTAISTDAELTKKLDNIEKKSPSEGNMKKYLITGGVIIGAFSIYEAIEYYAKSKTGCFLYTKDSTGTSVCKVLNASCLNPDADETFQTCTAEEMGTALTAITCDSWDEDSDGACFHCSYNDFDESELLPTQTLQCVEKPSFSGALGDILYNGGESIIGGIGDTIKSIIKYGLYGLVIIIILVVIYYIYIFFRNRATTNKNKRKEENIDKEINKKISNSFNNIPQEEDEQSYNSPFENDQTYDPNYDQTYNQTYNINRSTNPINSNPINSNKRKKLNPQPISVQYGDENFPIQPQPIDVLRKLDTNVTEMSTYIPQLTTELMNKIAQLPEKNSLENLIKKDLKNMETKFSNTIQQTFSENNKNTQEQTKNLSQRFINTEEEVKGMIERLPGLIENTTRREIEKVIENAQSKNQIDKQNLLLENLLNRTYTDKRYISAQNILI
jgi:hypothetical protein